MTDQELDSLMRRVLMDAIRKDEEDAIDITDPFIPSRKHQRQMKEMLLDPLKWMRNKTKPVWKRLAQRVAVVLLIASVSLGGVMAVSPTVRAAVIQWMTEWYETHIIYRFIGDEKADTMPEYEITDLPEGYAENKEQRVVQPSYIRIKYQNEKDSNAQAIYLRYMHMQKGTAADFVIEDVEVIPVTVNGMEWQFFLQTDWENNRSTITWIDSENNFQFAVDAPLNEKDIVELAESVSIINKK